MALTKQETKELAQALVDAGVTTANGYTDDQIAAVQGEIDGLAGGFQGALVIADTPVNDGVYFPTEDGTYTNAGGLVVDLSAGLTYIIKSGDNYTMNVVPIDLSGYVADSDLSITIGKNLFNKALATDGYSLNPSGAADVAAGYGYTDYIAVTPGLAYSGKGAVNNMRKTAYYDASKVLVAGGSSVAVTTFTPPVGVAYVRVTFTLTDKDTFQFEQSSVPTAFETYSQKITAIKDVGVKHADKEIYSKTETDTLTTDSRRVARSMNVNLFNVDALVDGSYFNTSGIPTAGVSGQSKRTGYIDIEGATQITFVNKYVSVLNTGDDRDTNFKIVFTDAAYTILQVTNTTTATQTISVPTNTKYVGWTVMFRTYGNDASTLMLVRGATAPARYYAYGEFISDDLARFVDERIVEMGAPSRLFEQSWSAFGDSITLGRIGSGTDTANAYPTLIGARNSMTVENLGVSGTHLCFYTSGATNTFPQRIKDISTDADIITIFGGTNDKNNSVPGGVASDYTDFGNDINNPVYTATNNTICGNVAWIIKMVLAAHPGKKLMFITPYLYDEGELDSRKVEINTAIINTCNYYAIPVLDLHKYAGFTYRTPTHYSALIGDGLTDTLHHNATGQAWLSYIIEDFIKINV